MRHYGSALKFISNDDRVCLCMCVCVSVGAHVSCVWWWGQPFLQVGLLLSLVCEAGSVHSGRLGLQASRWFSWDHRYLLQVASSFLSVGSEDPSQVDKLMSLALFLHEPPCQQ